MIRKFFLISLLLLQFQVLLSCRKIQNLENWHLQSDDNLNPGALPIQGINKQIFNVKVPCTVMACLLQNNVWTDIFYADNLKQVDSTLFDSSWWYTNEFTLDASESQNTIELVFKGINYKANVYVNNVQISNSTKMVGTFVEFIYDITSLVQFGSQNINKIQVQVFKPNDAALPDDNQSTDLAISFVDWNPYPADNSMGIWKPVELHITKGISLNYPLVITDKLSDDLKTAKLSIMVEVTNYLNKKVCGILMVKIPTINNILIVQQVDIKANTTQKVWINHTTYNQLKIKNPKLWQPWQFLKLQDGEQFSTLQTVQFSFYINRTISESSDSLETQFGIRQVKSKLVTKNNYRLFYVNKQKILIKGGGWSPDMFLRETDVDTHFKYMRDLGLNAVRLEGKFEDDRFFQLADKYGILVIPGFCCCDAWQHWDLWQDEQFVVAKSSMRSQAKRLRIFPSVMTFIYSSDQLPPEQVELDYLDALNEEFWPTPTLNSAADTESNYTGKSGVKMTGPYVWEPPNYWYNNQLGAAYGFLTEGGPGATPFSVESFSMAIPSTHNWPIDDMWNYHCANQGGTFGDLTFYTPELEGRYGVANSQKEYLDKSQVAQYEALRAMFEAYIRNKYTSTGVIQWMLNNAWPSQYWHIYDYFYNPNGGYYGTKKACGEWLHAQWSYDDNSIWVLNQLYQPYCQISTTKKLDLTVQIFNILQNGDINKIYETSYQVVTSNLDSDTGIKVDTLPMKQLKSKLAKTYFINLQLKDTPLNKQLSKNVYVWSTQPDVLDWENSDWYITPVTQYADFTLLQLLPKVDLQMNQSTIHIADNGLGDMETDVQLYNPSTNVAFFIYLKITKGVNGQIVLPVYWNDNYVTLFPREHATLKATYYQANLGGQTPTLVVEHFNKDNYI